MEAERGAPIVAQLEKYVPVLVTIGSDAKRNLDRLRDDVTMIATAVGKKTEGDKLLADLDARIAVGEDRDRRGRPGGKQFAMADGWKEGSTVSIRMFGKGALVSDIGTAIGLENAWTAAGDPQWGLGQTDVEGMKALEGKDVRFFYNASDGVDVFADGLAGNAIWDSLAFVKDGKVHQAAQRHLDLRRPEVVRPVDRRGRRGVQGLMSLSTVESAAPASAARRRPPGAQTDPGGGGVRRRRRPGRACSPRSTSPRAPRRSARATCCGCSSAPATTVRPTCWSPRGCPGCSRRWWSAWRSAWPAPACSRWPATRWPRRTPSRSTRAPTSRWSPCPRSASAWACCPPAASRSSAACSPPAW